MKETISTSKVERLVTQDNKLHDIDIGYNIKVEDPSSDTIFIAIPGVGVDNTGFESVSTQLSGSFGQNVLTLDRPGYANSSIPKNPLDLHTEGNILLIAIRKALNENSLAPKKIVFIGHSKGGQLALELAKTYKSLGYDVPDVILISTAEKFGKAGKKITSEKNYGFLPPTHKLANLHKLRNSNPLLVKSLRQKQVDSQTNQFEKKELKDIRTTDYSNFIDNNLELLEGTNIHTLAGDSDFFVPDSNTASLSKRLDGKHTTARNTTHAWNYLNPNKLTAVIARSLNLPGKYEKTSEILERLDKEDTRFPETSGRKIAKYLSKKLADLRNKKSN